MATVDRHMAKLGPNMTTLDPYMATLDPNIIGSSIIAAPVRANTLILFNRDVFKTTSFIIVLPNDHRQLQYYTLVEIN